MNRHTKFSTLYCAGLLLALLFLADGCAMKERPVQYVAYIGFDLNNPKVAADRQYVDQLYGAMLKEYLQRMNRKGYAVRLDTLLFDCPFQEDSARIREIYRQIEANPNIMLVIDNTWGKHIKHAQPLIRDLGIPVIALSADQNELDYAGNALFLYPNDPQPMYMVHFIRAWALSRSAI